MTEANDAVIVAAVRTPIGRSGRSLAGLTVQDIGMQTVAGVIDRGRPGPRRHRRPRCSARSCSGAAAPPATWPTPWGCRPTRRAAPCSASAPPA